MSVALYQSTLSTKQAQLAKIERVLNDPRLEPLSWLQLLLITFVTHGMDHDIPAVQRYFDE